MVKNGWSQPLEDGSAAGWSRALNLKDAADYVMKLPKAEQKHERWRSAVEVMWY